MDDLAKEFKTPKERVSNTYCQFMILMKLFFTPDFNK